MRYHALLRVYSDDTDKVYRSFEPELNEKKRSNFKLKKEKDYVLFEIESEDSVALRATLNGITKLMTVYEKTEKV